MPCEIELKYAPPAELWAETLFSDAGIAPFAGEKCRYTMHTEYLDTKSGAAKEKGLTLRRRFENGESVLYAKCKRSEAGALSVRGEWRVVSDDIDNACSLLEKAGAPTGLLRGEKLYVCASVRFVREEVLVTPYDGFSFLLSFDEGVFGVNTPFTEIELELVSGSKEELTTFGNALAKKYALTPEARSKYARALECAHF
ncbi:MAG: CYTH domain-containing protein [Oscillospiraceae bacterium]|nr:CYTH domain-containing protein [Oscillospiraceae bacterium]MBQ8861284.1 CYTH domain-containing protein [Clostridia bacterium]